ncbi:hypothetical protein DN752_10390 [Echinicola strongylocentroti]|uniref:DUF4919 domain-containing protein n=1 Tax=Echinicola strongylocentroti TaxID=1795355 RepID=A0A2Z4IID9_9BACT|nr:DUF4919 domain-containing protein [Echinicola strongylocentroti]AWW30499.1 hypothetical protein DN752_10390 [Echinicola strongylocentroti]
MKKLTIFCLAFLCSQVANAQYWEFEKPNYETIEVAVKDSSSPMYYPRLLGRFEDGDTTLTIAETRHLYYGFVFHPSYSLDSGFAKMDSLELILQKQDHDKSDLRNIIAYGNEVLRQDPFELNVMNYQLYALEILQDSARYAKVLFKIEMVCETLMSSGDGSSSENAFYVIHPNHITVLLHALGLRSGEERRSIGHYDYLELAANDIGLEGLYFDLGPYRNFLSDSLRNNNL